MVETPLVTTVHLLRHGEVHNPDGILYGRLDGYRLSERGRAMARRVAEHLGGRGEAAASGPRRDVVHVVASPLERAQETAAPIAAEFGLEVATDPRFLEAENHFEGLTFGVGDGSLRRPRHWRHLWNPFRPSWGEPYGQIAERVLAAAAAARDDALGHEAVLVSHQLPIWVARLRAEGRRLWHDPRRRVCSLASITSLNYEGTTLTSISYAEPAADLLPAATRIAGA